MHTNIRAAVDGDHAVAVVFSPQRQQFENDLDLEVLRPLAAAVGKIYQDFRNVQEDGGLHRYGGLLRFLGPAKNEIGPG